jgi:hypothetical protein
MSRKRSILGYIWVAAALAMMLFLFGGSEFWQDILFTRPGVIVSPRFTGGEIQQTLTHPDYRTQIHQPVFDGYFGDSKNGFVLIDWVSDTGLPRNIDENIDYDNDGSPDFKVCLDTVANTVEMQALSNKVKDISDEKVMHLENRRTVRVYITK